MANLFQKIEIVEAELWNLNQFEYVEFDGDFHFILISVGNNLFELVWSKNQNCHFKLKFGIYFEYVKFDGDVLFFCFRLIMLVLSKKSIWHFNVTWLISLQFIRRGLKLVVFLVISSFMLFLNKFYFWGLLSQR